MPTSRISESEGKQLFDRVLEPETVEDQVISDLFSSLKKPPEPLAAPRALSTSERFAAAFAGAMDPQFRQSFVQPIVNERRQLPLAQQGFRQQQEDQRLSRQLTLAGILEKRRTRQAEGKLAQDEAARKNRETNAKIDALKARADFLKRSAGTGAKKSTLATDLDKQIKATMDFLDSMKDEFGEIPPARQARAKAIQDRLEKLLKRQEEVLRRVNPELKDTLDIMSEEDGTEEDFFSFEEE